MKIISISIKLILVIMILSCNHESNNNNEAATIKIDNEEHEFYLTYDPKEQKKKDRVWKELRIRNLFEIGGVTDTILLNPISLKVDKDDNIFVIDLGDFSIKKFNKDGKIVKKIGRKGRGPNEFVMPFNLDVNKNNILVSDAELNRCSYFKKDSANTIKMNFAPTRGSIFSDQEIIVLQIDDLSRYPHLIKCNLAGKILTKYENIIQADQIDAAYRFNPLFIGDIFTHNKNLIYIPNFMNHILCYSDNGDLKYSVKTIDHIEEPVLKMKRLNGGYAVSASFPVSQMSSFHAQIFRNHILILSKQATNRYNAKVLDIYSAANGNYLYSYKVFDIDLVSSIYFTNERVCYITPQGSIKVSELIM